MYVPAPPKAPFARHELVGVELAPALDRAWCDSPVALTRCLLGGREGDRAADRAGSDADRFGLRDGPEEQGQGQTRENGDGSSHGPSLPGSGQRAHVAPGVQDLHPAVAGGGRIAAIFQERRAGTSGRRSGADHTSTAQTGIDDRGRPASDGAVRRRDSIRRIEVSTRSSGVRRPARHTTPGSSLMTWAPGGSARRSARAAASAGPGAAGHSTSERCTAWYGDRHGHTAAATTARRTPGRPSRSKATATQQRRGRDQVGDVVAPQGMLGGQDHDRAGQPG